MKFFIDTEFLEGKQDKKIFGIKYGETKPTIDLISIGIVSEDGREYYAISKDFNLDEAWDRYDLEKRSTNAGVYYEKVYWIRENILRPILTRWNPWLKFSYECFKQQLEVRGKTNEEIADEVCSFIDARWVDPKRPDKGYIHPCDGSCGEKHIHTTSVEFYTYYGAYDHVVFCWLFGRMINLPKGFPMYSNDLKQMIDEKARNYDDRFMNGNESFSTKLDYVKNKDDYPDPPNNHIAIEDAWWNKRLYEFINTLD